MMCPKTRSNRSRRGLALAVSLLLVAVLATLSLALLGFTDLSLQKSVNHENATRARMTAESGMAYVAYLMSDLQQQKCFKTAPPLVDVVEAHLEKKLIPGLLADDPNSIIKDGNSLSVEPIRLSSDETFWFTMTLTQNQQDPNYHTLDMRVTGQCGSLQRKLGMQYQILVDTTLLRYAMVSRTRIIARGNVRVKGDLYSCYAREWPNNTRNKTVNPIDIKLDSNGWISGDIATAMSEDEFRGIVPGHGNDANFLPQITWTTPNFDDPNYGGPAEFKDANTWPDPSEALRSQITYGMEESELLGLDTDDFDTSPLKDRTSAINLPTADEGSNVWKDWGATDANGNLLDPNKPPLQNIFVAQGTNPTFENCRFKGITYFDVDPNEYPTSSTSNKVQFTDCTFEGPIITGVPKQMEWSVNKMNFDGDTRFKSSAIQATLGGATLIAPNYNVNIGGCNNQHGDWKSEICGLVVGGVVDLRNKIKVKGTVISMSKMVVDGAPIMGKGWGFLNNNGENGVCGSNLGNYSGGNNEVDLEADPNNVVPLGIKKKYIVTPLRTTYIEYRP